MRRCRCAPARQVSSCSLLLPSWAIAHTLTHSRRQAATTTSAAMDGEGTASAASASSSPNSSKTATPTTAAASADTAAAPCAPHSASAGAPVPVAAASDPPLSATKSSASLAEMTNRLREALRALLEVERAKAELANKTATPTTTLGQQSSTSAGEGRVGLSIAAAMQCPSTAVSPAVVSAASTVEDSMVGGINRFSSSSNIPGSEVSAAASANAISMLSAPAATSAAAAMPPSTSPYWIRNKKPKFWALVNDAGAEDVEDGDDDDARRATVTNVDTVNAGDGPLAAAPSGSEASRLTSGMPSPPLKATTAVLTSGVTPLGQTHSHVSAADEALKTPSDAPARSSTLTSTAASTALSAAVGGGTVAAVPMPLKAIGDTITPHSVRISTSVSPFRNPYKRDVAHVLSELLSSDPALGPQLLGQLSAESRRLLLIMGAASEYFGVDYEEVAEQVKEADTDRDNSISSKEYDAWVRRMANSTPAKRRHAREGSPITGTSAPTFPPGAAASAAAPSVPSAAPRSSSQGAAWTPPSEEASATALSRQRAEEAIDTAKAAGARIIGAIQKSAPLVAMAPASRDTVGGNPGPSAAIPSPAPSALEGNTLCSSRSRIVDAAGSGAVGSPSPPSPSATTVNSGAITPSKQEPGYIPWPTYLRIVAAAAPPFLAFGMLDNSTLVLAGGAIDNALSGSLGLSQMAAASLGGVVSGVAGIQVHGLAERYTRAAPPRLAAEQQRSESYSRATQWGNTLGMVVGLVLGMTPLLFMSGSTQLAEQEERDRHQLQQEAARSHERHCRAMEKEEVARRQQLWEEESTTWGALLRDEDQHRLLSFAHD
ncbi:hypothetical protein LSCM1_07219 [Leishmania martiniquensis]|uniref:EF-hand domain-containing protein n=1 Tax=Leishmania martiniquensis TaxID=1580590 RepID=A0A836H2Q2_9TRYP|nr:hypothetical protein LSCM1_07219 [Leishmania martiniquensis]